MLKSAFITLLILKLLELGNVNWIIVLISGVAAFVWGLIKILIKIIAE